MASDKLEFRDFLSYSHRSTEIDNFRDFFNVTNSIVFPAYSFDSESKYENNLKDLCNFEVDGVSNFELITNSYPEEIKNSEWKAKKSSKDISIIDKLYPNTLLYLPISKVNLGMASIIGYNQSINYNKYKTFFLDQQKKLQSDPEYVRATKINLDNKEAVVDVRYEVSVWLLQKSDILSSGSLKPKPNLINLTKSVISVTTQVSQTGGNFSINISPILLNNLYESTMKPLIKSDAYYRFICENDIIFIRFETLALEDKLDRIGDSVNFSSLPNKVYDMIGLVDTVSESETATDLSVTIKGRDLIKLLIDDQNYFYPILFAGSVESSFGSQLKEDRFYKRLFTSGKFENYFVYSFRSIEKTLLFITSQLANLGILPDKTDVFASYGGRRSYIYDVTEDSLIKKELARGVWQIIKLQVDDNVKDRYLADPSLSNPDGSILNQMKKICQEPLVEFMTDTYGDMFYLIARKPPFDKKSMLDILRTDGMVIDIEMEDVIDSDLDFSKEVYSWYQIKPEGAFLGSSKSIALAYIPIVYFQEYANIWGAKRKEIISNYVSYRSFFGNKGKEDYNTVKSNVIKDLIYVIESSQYLPFTRTGRITINGDRRIKRGNFVRFKRTGEIFYVDSLTNQASINENSVDRTTTLNVSRGMVEKYIEGQAFVAFDNYARDFNDSLSLIPTTIKFSYFDIINLSYLEDGLKKQTKADSGSSDAVPAAGKSGVNKEVFNFFLSRGQFL